jgi:phosphonate transport system substrate-binding protein
MRIKGAFLLLAVGVAVILGGCRRESAEVGPRYGTAPAAPGDRIYQFAVHPLYNPERLFQAYQPLIDYLNREVKGGRFELEASLDYPHFEEKIRYRKPEFLLPNPWQTTIAMPLGYQVIAMAGDPADFRGLFIARKDSPLRVPADLKGQAVSYPARTALAACIMPQYFLYRQKLDVVRDLDNRYVGSQDSAIMNAYLGKTAVGVTWPPPWRIFQKEHPREAAELKVLWETESFVNNSVMVRNDVPPVVREQVRVLLLRLGDTPSGAKILAGMETARFLPAGDDAYDCVRRYIADFERDVRPVEW